MAKKAEKAANIDMIETAEDLPVYVATYSCYRCGHEFSFPSAGFPDLDCAKCLSEGRKSQMTRKVGVR